MVKNDTGKLVVERGFDASREGVSMITEKYISRAALWLMITTVIYFLMNGAQLFETALIVPAWTPNPPASFHVFQGEYGLDFKVFWIVFHSIHEVTFILAIIFCWRLTGIRKWLLILFAIHFAVRVWTLAYFAPNIIEFQQMPYSQTSDTELLQRTIEWQNLNYLRVAVFIAVSLGLIPLLNNLFRLKYSNR
jgi:hypothetical protein